METSNLDIVTNNINTLVSNLGELDFVELKIARELISRAISEVFENTGTYIKLEESKGKSFKEFVNSDSN